MKDEEIAQMAEENKLYSPKPPKYTLRSLITFIVGVILIWIAGVYLSPLVPEEIFIMILYGIIYVFFGFDPIKFFLRK